jgi:hypothetical protein
VLVGVWITDGKFQVPNVGHLERDLPPCRYTIYSITSSRLKLSNLKLDSEGVPVDVRVTVRPG